VKEAGYDATQERTELGAPAPAEVSDVSITSMISCTHNFSGVTLCVYHMSWMRTDNSWV